MPQHNTNTVLKFGLSGALILILIIVLVSCSGGKKSGTSSIKSAPAIKNNATTDSASESLDTLTADLKTTHTQLTQIMHDNATLMQQNRDLQARLNGGTSQATAKLASDFAALKQQVLQGHASSDYKITTADGKQPITVVDDLTAAPLNTKRSFSNLFNSGQPGLTATSAPINSSSTTSIQKLKPVPYFTIPANATAVHDRLMSSLVGRIPVKGVVTDPYPFKIVFSNDTLAANGLRVPHLRQMIVSGYSEGDLNLVSVRGWVTSLTFVFEDGTITTTTSNNDNIGNFTKENALGYLSDPRGNPFIRGKLITNAPTYLGGNILLGTAEGAASAYAQAQTTSQSNMVGGSSSAVTGSPGKYVLGQSLASGTSQAQQWWADREQSSFDAIYVPSGAEIVVNFAKEILIDYDPNGRKLAYAHTSTITMSSHLD